MNAGMGNLSLLQGIFLTQELNWGLLHCRWILYQLSHLDHREAGKKEESDIVGSKKSKTGSSETRGPRQSHRFF